MLVATLALLPVANGEDNGDIIFTDIAQGAGINYQHVPSATMAVVQATREQSLPSPVTVFDVISGPVKPHGHPGVALFDFDRDGDLDIYVTNGPGAANSLFSNQLVESDEVAFADVALAAGVDAIAQDSTGVCYGDTDNDGDHDLVVLGRVDPGILFFENNGDGSFHQPAASGLEGDGRTSLSCSMGDVNGDGLLDVFVGNLYDISTGAGIFFELFAVNQHNRLFLNQGNNIFADVSASSGIENIGGVPAGAATLSWAVALADVDLDGDIDIVTADDQGEIPSAAFGSVDRGYIHVFLNDGTGHFADSPVILNPFSTGAWMGLGFGDLNCDGALDIYASNFGDYDTAVLGTPDAGVNGARATRWLLGNGDGTFTDPGVGSLGASVFGWGTAVFDYDNDGDADLYTGGSLNVNLLVLADNPGVLLQNQGCSALFLYDAAAITTDHLRRNVQGVAVGDLNLDGFVDIVTSSNTDMPEPLPLIPGPASFGSVFDAVTFFVPIYAPVGGGLFVWTGFDTAPGSLTVELNSADNGNNWAAVRLLGTIGLTSEGRVNRDGIGAVVFATPEEENSTIIPVLGGSSFISQHSLVANFGMGDENRADVEILWPGGVRNKLFDVRDKEQILFPEIPCSFDTEDGAALYQTCVRTALRELREAGVIDRKLARRLRASAFRAFAEAQGLEDLDDIDDED
ncbi:MAG: CRTAC1 family protein [Terriglobia bacterium]